MAIRGSGKPQAVQARGTCAVCRSTQKLLHYSGKVAVHGKTAAAPRGCAGSYKAPLRPSRPDDKPGDRGATVVGFRPGEPGPSAREGPSVRPSRPDPPAAS